MTFLRMSVPRFVRPCVRTCRSLLVGTGLVIGLGLGGVSVEVVWAQQAAPTLPEAEQPVTAEAAPAESVVSPLESSSRDGQQNSAGAIDAELPESPAEPSSPAPTMPERERVVLQGDHWPQIRSGNQSSTDLLMGTDVSSEIPDWGREESGVTEHDGVLVVRSRRFSSPEEAWRDLTVLAVAWLRQKYEPETGHAIRNPVAVLHQNPDKMLMLQTYLQDISLNDQKVIETPMYIAHLKMMATPALREGVYADWRAQLVNRSLLTLVGGAAMLSVACAGIGRWMRSPRSPIAKQSAVSA